LGHAATRRFPSPLVEPDVPITGIRLVWGFLCPDAHRSEERRPKGVASARRLADRARSRFPDDLMIESYRAHALMFLERGEESKALYLAHKGKPVLGLDGKLWERFIVGAFSDLREAGLTHPMMADIEKELGVSP
jgi:hypothetical protein